jgi:hypothetical protein
MFKIEPGDMFERPEYVFMAAALDLAVEAREDIPPCEAVLTAKEDFAAAGAAVRLSMELSSEPVESFAAGRFLSAILLSVPESALVNSFVMELSVIELNRPDDVSVGCGLTME